MIAVFTSRKVDHAGIKTSPTCCNRLTSSPTGCSCCAIHYCSDCTNQPCVYLEMPVTYKPLTERPENRKRHAVEASWSCAPSSSCTRIFPTPSIGTTTRRYCASIRSTSVVAGYHALAIVRLLAMGARCDTALVNNIFVSWP